MGMRPERCALARRIHGSLGVQWRARSRDSPAIFGAKYNSRRLFYTNIEPRARARGRKQSVSQSVISRSRPALTPPPARKQATSKIKQASKERGK